MSLASNLQNFATRVGTEAKALRSMINGNMADLTALQTVDKSNLVAAINEIRSSGGSSPGPATETSAGVVELATAAEATAGTDATRAVTPVGVAAAIAQLVDNSPATLDTLNELAAALGDDPNFATTVSNQIGTKQDQDATLTALAGLSTAVDQMIYATGIDSFAMTELTPFARTLLDDTTALAARATLSVYSQAEIGNPETDFVATFNAALV